MTTSLLAAHFFSLSLSCVIAKGFWEFDDAPGALAFYGVYHRYGWNQVIHFFGVPGILWSLLVFLVHVPLPFIVPNIAKDEITTFSSFNYGSFLAISYGLFYLSIDSLGGSLYMPFLYAMYASARNLAVNDQCNAKWAETDTKGKPAVIPWYGTGNALRIALVVQILCWYLQVHLGHQIIEGAQPAILESLGGALTIAPLFAFYEAIWALGINRELQESTLLLVEEYTRNICSEVGAEATMKACRNLVLEH